MSRAAAEHRADPWCGPASIPTGRSGSVDFTDSSRFSNGIEVDVCPNGNGIWLDCGELERLVSQAAHDL